MSLLYSVKGNVITLSPARDELGDVIVALAAEKRRLREQERRAPTQFPVADKVSRRGLWGLVGVAALFVYLLSRLPA